MELLKNALDKWSKSSSKSKLPSLPKKFVTVKLGNEKLFSIGIGRRVLKKDIYQKQTSIPLFSANVRKPFGCVDAPNAGNLPLGGVLWSIDSDFDCVGVSPGQVYSITDHCGQAKILVQGIEPRYLARQIRQAGNDMGLNRDYRASLNTMADLEFELPVKEDGAFDYDLMNEWSEFQENLELVESNLIKLIK